MPISGDDLASPGVVPDLAAHDADDVLQALLGYLAEQNYRFIVPTPKTHERILNRSNEQIASDLRDAFGWNRPFATALLPRALFEALRKSGTIIAEKSLFKSRIRVASAGPQLFLHSGYPTIQRNAVFFGPDSYRFLRFLAAHFPPCGSVHHIVDIGAGSGVGGIMAGLGRPEARISLLDINAFALRLARINARHAGVAVQTLEGFGLDPLDAEFDLAIMNPPFIVDPLGRAYRDGGDLMGAGLSVAWAVDAACKIAPGGRVILYTGSAIVAGEDLLQQAIERALPPGFLLHYEELDPDIFGELLDEDAYAGVDRIAAVGAVIDRAA